MPMSPSTLEITCPAPVLPMVTPRPLLPPPVPVRVMLPLPVVRRLLLVSWMPWLLAPTVPPRAVMAMSPLPASSVAPVRAAPTKVPVEPPAVLAASVIGAPLEASVPLTTMLRLATRSSAPPGAPLSVAEPIVTVWPLAPRSVSGVAPPSAALKVTLPVLVARRPWAPSIVLEKTIAPAPALRTASAPSTTAGP